MKVDARPNQSVGNVYFEGIALKSCVSRYLHESA